MLKVSSVLPSTWSQPSYIVGLSLHVSNTSSRHGNVFWLEPFTFDVVGITPVIKYSQLSSGCSLF